MRRASVTTSETLLINAMIANQARHEHTQAKLLSNRKELRKGSAAIRTKLESPAAFRSKLRAD